MATSITRTMLEKLGTFFSIKNFIADLPRMLNEAFTTVYKCILDIYNPDDNSINCQKGNIDYIVATTVVAQNLRVGDSSTNISALAQRIDDLEEKFNRLQFITKEMIDNGIDTRPYYDPDASIN